jgi:hypothetical protein
MLTIYQYNSPLVKMRGRRINKRRSLYRMRRIWKAICHAITNNQNQQ